jgi:hypothetical protein
MEFHLTNGQSRNLGTYRGDRPVPLPGIEARRVFEE